MSSSFAVVATNTRGETLEIGRIYPGRNRSERTLIQSAKNVISRSPHYMHLPVDKLEYKITSGRVIVMTTLDKNNQPIAVSKVQERWDHKEKDAWRG